MSARDRSAVVCDTSVLLNFLVLDRIDLLAEHPRYRFHLPEEVRLEVAVPLEAERLERCLREGAIEILRLQTIEDLTRFAELDRVLGRGEAAAIAAAAARRWLVAIDERGRALRAARECVGATRIVNTPGILLASIRAGDLEIAQADKLKAELETKRFRMRFGSFRELL